MHKIKCQIFSDNQFTRTITETVKPLNCKKKRNSFALIAKMRFLKTDNANLLQNLISKVKIRRVLHTT